MCWGSGASDLFGPSAGRSVGAHHGGGSWALALAGGEERQENRFRDWHCARAIVEGDEESASSAAFLVISERQNNTVLLFAAGRDGQGAGANLHVVSRRSPSLGVAGEDCSTLVVCFSHQLLSTRSPASNSHTRSSTSARHCLLRLEASARRLAGGSQSDGSSNVDHDEDKRSFRLLRRGEPLFSLTCSWSCTHRAVGWLVHMLIPGPAVSLLHGRKFAKGRHFLDAFKRVGGVRLGRHLARAAEIAEKKGKGLLQQASIAKKQFVLLQPSSIALLFRRSICVRHTRDIGRMAQWTREF